jgi:hypothetical protein
MKILRRRMMIRLTIKKEEELQEKLNPQRDP